MTKALASALVLALTLVPGPAWAQPAPTLHLPPAGGVAGQALELVVDAPAATPTLVAHYRRPGASAFTALELVRRGEAQWVAVVPRDAVTANGVEYYVSAGARAVFASAEAPHRISVSIDQGAERRARDLARRHGHRSRVHVGGEWVNYGPRLVGDKDEQDYYYRFDADFSYRLLAYPLEEVRVGYTRLLGKTLTSEGCPEEAPCSADAGYKVGGWFELGLASIEGIRLDARLLVMATQSGFKVGGRGEVRLGVLEASHVALGVESMADVGTSGFFRLGWGTVPNLPMAATVEVTRLPDEDRDTGVRLFYDVARALGENLHLGLRVGYASRNQKVGSFTAGANAVVDF